MSRYFLTSPDTAVDQALKGLVRSSDGALTLNEDPRYVYGTRRSPERKVGLVSGGGSGHEPLHAGLIGPGLLDAAVPGAIFASPHNRQVYEASRRVAGPGGVLHIVKNYTGDNINFGIAAERLRLDGIDVGTVVIDDDIATDDPSIRLGRRGTGATALVEKVLGAAADRGYGLDELVELGRRFVAGCRSVAVAAQPHTIVHTNKRVFELEDDRLEYGVGIHGERSGETIEAPPLPELVARLLDDLTTALGGDCRDAVLFVNGLGATTNLELHGVLELAASDLERRSWNPERMLVGSIVTALDMKGFSITIALLDDETRELWDDRGADRRWV